MFVQLSEEQIDKKIQFIENYLGAPTAADGAKLDANANVTQKNVATLEAEINKDINIQINRRLVSRKIKELFGEDMAKEYLRQIEQHEIYVHDETSLKPYCASITLYPLLTSGLKSIGGESLPPRHLESFCGSIVNLVFGVSAQFAGAVATVEFLLYFDHFARKDFGDHYLLTHRKEIENHLQHVVYAINQPAAARGYQSVFWNISVYDQHYFASLFEGFFFPDGDRPNWKSVERLQEFFLSWFNEERKKALLTFPVVTAALLTDGERPRDARFHRACARELAEGNSFFLYLSESADSLASCCRLRNAIERKEFSYSLGAGGVATGSINVITLNMNRIAQKGLDLKAQVEKIHCYQVAYRRIMEEYLSAGMLSAYTAGYIDLQKQFLTIGINGFVEAAEFLGIEVSNNPQYRAFIRSRLKTIFDANQEAGKKYGYKFNTEFVPAENLGPKNAEWDRRDGLATARDCYNSYFYVVENEACNPLDKMILHGKDSMEFLDGGSALHLNLDEKLNEEGYFKLISAAARAGCNYWCVNVKITICNRCETIDKRTLHHCPACGTEDVDHGTRVIGYLKRISSFSKARRKEAALRHYHREAAGEEHLERPGGPHPFATAAEAQW